tara:strand:- start:1281 stop:1700 length:420 start_codon:yes stop_codon:yes gene_type:complete
MSNQMTTPVSSIPITNNVKPNEDIQDPIVQEILGNMAENANTNVPNLIPAPIIREQVKSNPPQYNYPIQNENESFLSSFYDKKITILTFIMIIAIIAVYSTQFQEIIDNIKISYIEEYKGYIKYLVLYLILYIIQKYDF